MRYDAKTRCRDKQFLINLTAKRMINMNFMAPLNLFASIKKIYVRFIDFERLNLNFGAKAVIFISCPLFLSAVFF